MVWQILKITDILIYQINHIKLFIPIRKLLKFRIFSFLFFPLSPGGLGSLRPAKILLLLSMTDRSPCFLIRVCSPNEFCSWKFQKLYLNCSLKFVYFLAQNCIRKLYFMLKTVKPPHQKGLQWVQNKTKQKVKGPHSAAITIIGGTFHSIGLILKSSALTYTKCRWFLTDA